MSGRLNRYAPLLALTVAVTVFQCAYVLTGTQSSWLGQVLAGMALPLFLVMWIEADASRLRRYPCHDFGLFLVLTFPLSLFWYCCWSRGWRGLLLFLGLLVLMYVPAVFAGVLWDILYGPR